MTIAIIDGDVLAYQACKPRWEKKARVIRELDLVTSFVALDEDGKRIPLEFTVEEDQAYLEESWNNFKKDLQNLVDKIFADTYLMAVKGPDNFRNLMFPEYKLNRHADPNKQNLFVPTLRELAVMEDLAVAAEGCEADDLLRIWAEQATSAGQEYIICSIDKDLRCIPGKHYLMHKDTLITITPEEAMRHYYEQLLKGDPTDNIPGVPRVGEVKATKILAQCVTEEEFQEKVVEQYIIAYNDDWYQYLISNGKMIHLQKHPGDYFSPRTWPIVQELL